MEMPPPDLPRGVRWTPQRRAVLAALTEADGPFTLVELHKRARAKAPRLGLATVYRTVELLRETESVRPLPTEGRSTYVRCHPGHHHHLVCRSCGSVQETDLCACPAPAELKRRHDFVPESHAADVYGLCGRCR
ncbi:MAG TPA: Fur family transcriptional regulator [Gaiellaceae bacterium]|nr:Fur family transcriptional regulator [Gaiellaceae bacterium]